MLFPNRFCVLLAVVLPLVLSGVSVSSVSAEAQVQPPPAAANPSATTPPTSAPAIAPFLLVTKYDKVGFGLPPLAILQTWQIQSDGVCDVEMRVWYIAGGKATLRDQREHSWDDKYKQVGTWRLMLLEQKAASEDLLPLVGLQTVFNNGGPNSSGIGLADSASRAPIHLPSPFFVFYNTTDTEDPTSVIPFRPFVLYAARTEKSLIGSRLAGLVARNAKLSIDANNMSGVNNPFNGRDISRLIARDEKKPVEALTKLSKTPGTAFLVLTLQWNPPEAAPKP